MCKADTGDTKTAQRIPWQSNAQDSMLSLPRARVQCLVGELRSHKLHGQKKKNTHTHKDSTHFLSSNNKDSSEMYKTTLSAIRDA